MRALKAVKVIMEHGKNSKAVRKVHTSAVMISPPQADWPQIQEIRKIYDKSYVRWMPHINLLYPFVHNDEFSTAVDRVKAAVASIKPFTVQFKQFDFFKHGKASYTMWLKPEVSNSSRYSICTCKRYSPFVPTAKRRNKRITTNTREGLSRI
jgi:hypothetical protein